MVAGQAAPTQGEADPVPIGITAVVRVPLYPSDGATTKVVGMGGGPLGVPEAPGVWRTGFSAEMVLLDAGTPTVGTPAPGAVEAPEVAGTGFSETAVPPTTGVVTGLGTVVEMSSLVTTVDVLAGQFVTSAAQEVIVTRLVLYVVKTVGTSVVRTGFWPTSVVGLATTALVMMVEVLAGQLVTSAAQEVMVTMLVR